MADGISWAFSPLALVGFRFLYALTFGARQMEQKLQSAQQDAKGVSDMESRAEHGRSQSATRSCAWPPSAKASP